MSAELRTWLEDYKREVRREGARELLRRLLRARFGELPAAAIARIQTAGTADLERWGERMFGARTLAEVFHAPMPS